MALSNDDLLSVIIIPIGLLVIAILSFWAFCALRRRDKDSKVRRVEKPDSKDKHQSPPEVFRKKSPPSDSMHMNEAKNGTFQPYPKNQNGSNDNQNGSLGNKDGGTGNNDGNYDATESNTKITGISNVTSDQEEAARPTTSRSESSNNSTMINVNEENPSENQEKSRHDSMNDDLNLTVTSMRHVELNDGSDTGRRDSDGRRESIKYGIGGLNQPPNVSSS